MNQDRRTELEVLAKQIVDDGERYNDGVELCELAARRFGVQVRLNEIEFLEEKIAGLKPKEDVHAWLMNAECEKCGRAYCDCESKY